jgi:parallel beta helix pectate lyase-like protein
MSSLRAIVAAAALASATASWAQDALRVPQDYPTIQAAIDAAAPGAIVSVAGGTYFVSLSIGKTITLASQSGAAVTMLDGGRVGRVIFARGTGVETVTIVGFTITNGLGLESMSVPAAGSGSGVYLESLAGATLRDNVIRNNVGCSGVGIAALDVTVAIVRNEIARNVQDSSCAGGDGGGILVRGGAGPSLLASNAISGNLVGGDGGGIEIQGATAVVQANDIRDNEASSGGGVSFDLADGVVGDNLLVRNSAETGGALRLVAADGNRVLVAGNTMLDNGATTAASAAQLMPVADEALRMRGNTISGDGAVELIRCETPFALSRSNALRNESGPKVGGLCTFGLLF